MFQHNDLGTTKDGGSLKTYKELCSLASELNKPDLIYKQAFVWHAYPSSLVTCCTRRFMSLANNQAMWNSRKGAASGFAQIAAHASAELEPHMQELIPKLYR